MKTIFNIFISFIAIFSFSDLIISKPIDLSKKEIFVKKGFSLNWIHSLPKDNSWKRIAPSLKDGRRLRIYELDLKGVPKRTFPFVKDYKAEHFTFVTSFHSNELPLKLNKKPMNNIYGILIGQIGINWEIYLNGQLIRKEMFLSTDGNIVVQRNLRDLIVEINPFILKEGVNILSFHIVGDPAYTDTGFYKKGPYVIDNLSTLRRENAHTLEMVLIFLYLFVGLYHLFMFFYRTSDLYNLFYSLFSLFLFIYFYFESPEIFFIIENTAIIYRIKITALCCILPFFFGFLELILFERIGKTVKAMSLYFSLLALLVLLSPLSVVVNIMYLFLVSSALIIIYYSLFHFLPSFYKNFKKYQPEEKFFHRLFSILKNTVQGNLFFGCVVLLICYFFEIYDVFYLSLNVGFARYGLMFLVLGLTFILGKRFMYIHNEIEHLHENLQQRYNDLDNANKQITISEEKYRFLVEGSEDVILSMDEKLNVLSVNKSINRQFNINEKMESVNLRDFLYIGNEDLPLSYEIANDKFDTFIENKKPVKFKAEFKSLVDLDSIEMDVRLENIFIDGKTEVIGKLSSTIEDSLLQYRSFAHQKYKISNSLFAASEIIFRISRELAFFLKQSEIIAVRMAVQEIMINAIEHGNLGITSEEKSDIMINSNYSDFIILKQKDAKNKEKKVLIEYVFDKEKIEFYIEDEGDGFDYNVYLNDNGTIAREQEGVNGRGISMAIQVFDSIEYIGVGNAVRMIKNFS